MDDAEHAKLSSMWNHGLFEPAIHYIRFPKFRNLSTNMTIKFGHPITAIVGPNGTNKSAILRALQGSPRGNDLGKYWFGTAVDEIPAAERHRFIYGRKSPPTGDMVEVIKTRIGRLRESKRGAVADPDLFETSRPLTTEPDNMAKFAKPPKSVDGDASSTRWSAISKDVVYLDFRSQLSAFDWAFNHSDVSVDVDGSQTELQILNARKRLIRSRTDRLSKAINIGWSSDKWFRIERILNPIVEMPESQLQWVSKILGKTYSKVRLIKHRYFGRAGSWTVILESKDLQYSEAFAGSGEFAAVLLVHRISNARPKSLILLDEPEVSLHPAAQRALSEFLTYSAKTQKHQIVFATHSSDMIANLPSEAVKVLTLRLDDGKVDIPVQNSLPQYAFHAIGAAYQRPTVVVEDQLAKELVEYALLDSPCRDAIRVQALPGGADTLWTYYVPMWAHEGRTNVLLLLDGDQRVDAPRPGGSIPPNELEAELINSFKGTSPQLPYSSTDGSPHRVESVMLTLDWRRRFVDFLPCTTPEVFLWGYRKSSDAESEGEITDENCKNLWREFTELETGQVSDASSILTFQRQALRRVPAECETLSAVRRIVEEFIGSQP
ncbi:AAA family ATPase [Nocardia nova]